MAAKKSKRVKRALPIEQPADSLLGGLLSLMIGLLLVVRMLMPTESAQDGSTLWIVQLWLAAGLLWAWNAFRERDDRIRWDRLDVAFWVVVVAHVVSAVAVLLNGGQRRAAINLTWEWVGLGISFFLIRQTVRTGVAARRLVGIMVAVGICLAALGVWQHYVSFPETRAEYQQNKHNQAWLIDAGVPQDSTGRALFEERLKSTEPFGMFALANTFAGLLLVWFLVAIGTIASAWQRRSNWKELLGPILAAGLMAYCLILTKSRTAGVGLLAGLTVWGACSLWRSGLKPMRWLAYTAAGCMTLLVMLAVAAVSGGFDVAVITQAPKSMSYRLQFWSGTWKVLCERPLLGTGPGNFRHLYLRYKLPESSEEIADPHNFMLDLWANGGLVALIGLLVFLFFVFRRLKSTSNEAADSTPVAGTTAGHDVRQGFWNPLTVGSGLAFFAAFAVSLLASDVGDLRLPVLMLGFFALFRFCGRISNSPGASSVCLIAAVVGLMTHLVGAGGIEMPAIVQTLLVLVAAAMVWNESDPVETASVEQRPRKTLAVAGLFGVLFIVCLLSATAPVLNRRALVAAADVTAASGADSATAVQLYRQAADADPFSSIPPQRLADLYFVRWYTLPGDVSREFQRAVGLQEVATVLDPHNPGSYYVLGRWFRERYRRTGEKENLKHATRALRQAVARYPNNAAFRADLALALDAAEKSSDAATEAAAALRQDNTNREHGHRDKFLDSQTIEALQELSGSPTAAIGGIYRN
jgi:hypothetical protein